MKTTTEHEAWTSDGARQPPPAPMTYEEFLEWADEDTYAEWVDGEVIMTSPASYPHQELVSFLHHVIHSFARLHQLGVVLQAPFQMKIGRSGREPDLIFIAAARLEQLKRTFLEGPADLAVEIVSPESVERDRRTKFAEYQAAGVGEYWLLDPDHQQANFYVLNPSGVYDTRLPDAGGLYHSTVLPDFRLPVSRLWQEPLPDVEDVLLEVGGEAYARRLNERLRKRALPPND